jgi:hypothetical protein
MLVASGQPMFVSRGRLAGQLERVEASAGGIRISGWAASLKADEESCTVAVFIGNRLAWAGATALGRPDLATQLRGRLRSPGFECVVAGESGDAQRVRAFAISHGGEALELVRFPRRPTRRRYELQASITGEAESLSFEGGGRLTLGSGIMAGFFDVALVRDDRAAFIGWAADLAHGRPAYDVAIFVNDRFVCARPPHVERPDVVQTFGSESLR